MDERIENLVMDLKSNSKFNLLKDRKRVGHNLTNWATYNEYTELESTNLKIIYVKDVIFSIKHSDEITILNKRDDSYAFCNSIFKEVIYNKKPIIKNEFNFEELKEYIENNL